MKNFTLIVGFLSIFLSIPSLQAQECTAPRYLEKVFSEIQFTPNIDFGGIRKNPVGAPTKLLLDLYEPKGDTAELRPLVMMIHGGAFLDIPLLDRRSPDIGNLAVDFAKRGYVVASPEYRLVKNFLNLADEKVMTKAVIASMIDVNDAICFFVDSYYNGNPYKIDINRVFVGGVSAGAVIALQGQFVNDTSDLNAERRAIIREVAAFDNRDVQSILTNKYCGAKILGTLNVSTMILDTLLIRPSETAVYFCHGTKDNITPFKAARPFEIPTLPIMYGPGVIAEKIKATGTRVDFDVWEGSWHVPFLEIDLKELLNFDINNLIFNYDILDSTTNHMARFCFELMECKTAVPTAIRNVPVQQVRVFPNPSTGNFRISLPEALVQKKLAVEVLNYMGQTVLNFMSNGNENTIQISDIPSGNYMIRISDKNNNGDVKYLGQVQVY
jgi:hypothetical protein